MYSNNDWESNRYIKLLAKANGVALANGEIDFDTFVNKMFGHEGLQGMIFRKFEMPLAEALRDWCHFACVDPMFVEVYIGERFEMIDFEAFEKAVESRTIRA